MQSPDYTQGYNRYSYVWNNPLKYRDPSGYFAEGSGFPTTDYFGRPKYDRYGVYIPPFLRPGGGTTVGWLNSSGGLGGGGTNMGQTPADQTNNIQFWKTITDILLNQPSGYTISLIQAFGRINYVGHFGELGEPIIHESGAISFSNNTAGLDAILNAVYGHVASSQGGGNETPECITNTGRGVGAFITLFLPFLLLNYFLVFHKEKYKILMNEFNGFRIKEGLAFMLYFFASLLLCFYLFCQ